MFESAIVDTAIGLIFVFLLMSLIASVAQEMISTFLQLRPANLQHGLRSLFSGDSMWGQDLVDMIYNHGLVRGLYSDPKVDNRAAANAAPAKPANFVAYVKTGAYVSLEQGYTFYEWIQRGINLVRMGLRLLLGLPHSGGGRDATQTALLPAYIPSRTFALAMIDFLNKDKASGNEAMKGITETLAEHSWIYRDNKAGQALFTLANDAKGDLDAFQKKLEDWYNDAMDRVSGWYKRSTQRVLLYIGIVLAVGFNVDSLAIAHTLWIDRDARKAMVTAADSYVQNHPTLRKVDAGSQPTPTPPSTGSADATAQTATSSQTAGDTQQATTGAAADGTNPGAATTPSSDELLKKMQTSVSAFESTMGSSLLPVGWKQPWSFYRNDLRAANLWPTVLRVLNSTRIPGCLITAFAISLGAPFWFDTLNKFMVVRSTIKPEEKSQTEASKD